METLPSPFTLLGGAAGAVVSMFAGSAFGDKGTLIGAAAGSVITATVSTAVEHHAKKAHEKLKGPRLPDKPVHTDAVLYARDLAAIRKAGERRRQHNRYRLAGIFTVMLVIPGIAAFSIMTVVEASTGGTVKGFTVWHPSPAVTRTVTPTPVVVTVTPSVTPSVTTSVVPSVSPSTSVSSSATVTPTVSPDSHPSIPTTPPTVTSSAAGNAPAGTPEDTPTVGNPP